MTGEELVDAQPSFDQNGRPAVNFRFNTSGARKFGDYTLDNIGAPFAIVLDDEVISAPVIQSHIPGGSGIITGNFTVEESTNLAVLLRAGALCLPGWSSLKNAPSARAGAGQYRCRQGCDHRGLCRGSDLHGAQLWPVWPLRQHIALIINVGLLFGLLSTDWCNADLAGHRGYRSDGRYGGGRQRADL